MKKRHRKIRKISRSKALVVIYWFSSMRLIKQALRLFIKFSNGEFEEWFFLSSNASFMELFKIVFIHVRMISCSFCCRCFFFCWNCFFLNSKFSFFSPLLCQCLSFHMHTRTKHFKIEMRGCICNCKDIHFASSFRISIEFIQWFSFTFESFLNFM